MPRRLALLLTAIASIAVLGCSSAPAAPALSDPKEILLQSVGALQNVKTVQLKGAFGGTVAAEGMGNFDLSTVKLDASLDVPGKKTRLLVDAPTLMGTTLDVIALTDAVYLKMTGPFAAFLGGDGSGKYVQMPADAGAVPEEATDPVKALEEFKAELDKLPKAPEKLADEKCGDQDCYHVRIALTAADLAALGEGDAGEVESVSVDIWSRKSDVRPAKFAFSVDAGATGTITGTFDLAYDGSVEIAAPPADQVVTAP